MIVQCFFLKRYDIFIKGHLYKTNWHFNTLNINNLIVTESTPVMNKLSY